MSIIINSKHPSYWGPHAWKFLHTVTEAYPTHPTQELMNETKQFFFSLGNLLPCPSCRLNYKKHLQKYPITDETVKTRINLEKWLINIHNEVNIMNKKKVWTYEELKAEKKVNSIFNFSNIFSIALLTFVLLIFISSMRKNS